MATTTFSGPIKAGTIKDTTGTTVGTDVKNTGFVKMAQTASWTQSTTAADTGITIPANSQITEIIVYITTACDAANISMGTSTASTELFTALAAGTAANVIHHGADGTITDADTWVDIGTSDLSIYIDFSAGTSGVGYVTVEYIQGINNA
ncbi:MAG: hypothetical protein CL886_09090 [Dehalococcoidia bacterium]|nr:hypothetical protein [Dehalococcoidia bacterium]|tara:strand:- start:2427 stop:2876 length:450 start_codon:yes stop_codon:yes gene_type:complete